MAESIWVLYECGKGYDYECETVVHAAFTDRTLAEKVAAAMDRWESAEVPVMSPDDLEFVDVLTIIANLNVDGDVFESLWKKSGESVRSICLTFGQSAEPVTVSVTDYLSVTITAEGTDFPAVRAAFAEQLAATQADVKAGRAAELMQIKAKKAASAEAAPWIDAEWDNRYHLPDARRRELNELDKWNKGRDWVSQL